MDKIDFTLPEWEAAQKVLDFYKQETTCFDKNGKFVECPLYVVAIDDDAISAFYAVHLAEQVNEQFGYKPKILCVGGVGMLSKYMNRLEDGTVLSEGHKLWMIVRKLGYNNCAILEKGNNTGANIKEIIDYLAQVCASRAPIVFCLPQRLSKRIERTVAFSTKQFPGTLPLRAYYYVPGESMQEMCQLYNGKGIAGGLPLLSETAALYDRMNRYEGVYQEPMDKVIDKSVIAAGEMLVRKFPVRVSRIPLSAPMQFFKMYLGVRNNRKAISDDLHSKIEEWKVMI